MPFSIGQTVGDYEVIGTLGAGGMGSVYRVRHLISERFEAMKLLLPELSENPDLADRFIREIRVQAKLCHPNIASLHNAFRSGNQLLMVMELVEGRTLSAILRERILPPPEAVSLIMQVLNALDYAHAQGVIHRDIKPANVMVAPDGQAKLMDFGIARAGSEELALTKTGATVGSVYYMSPEQVEGKPVDQRADLYSVGVMLFEILTGVRPIGGDTSFAVMNAHLTTVPPLASAVNPNVSESLAKVIQKGLSKNKDNRFPSARAFSACLAALVPSQSKPAGNQLDTTEVAEPLKRESTPVDTIRPVSKTSASPFEADRLEKLAQELAVYVGPVSKVLVSRAARKARTWRQLHETLALEVPEGRERQQFLALRP